MNSIDDFQICRRCECCSVFHERVTCWSCNGVCGDNYEDEWDDVWCDVCQGEGEIPVAECMGGCDENGVHKKPIADVLREMQQGEPK